jgi:hypothetical protein
VVVEAYDADIVARRIDLNGVMMAFHIAKREAGIEMRRDGDRIGWHLDARVEHRRGDAVAIRDRIIGRFVCLAPAAAAEIDRLSDGRRIVARRHHQRHAQR